MYCIILSFIHIFVIQSNNKQDENRKRYGSNAKGSFRVLYIIFNL